MSDKKKVPVLTPIGIVSYPFLATPDVDKQTGKKRYKVDIIVSKADWKTNEHAKDLQNKVLQVGRELLGNPKATFKDFENPFQDMDQVEDCHERLKGCIRVRAKSEFAPTLLGPSREDLTEDQIKAIKGGDYGRIGANVFGWTYLKKKGVSLGLSLFQFKQAGEALGQGNKAFLEMIDDLEVDVQDEEEDTEEESGIPSSAIAKSSNGNGKRGRPKKAVEPEPTESEEEPDMTFA